MKNRTLTRPAPESERLALPASVIAACHLVDQLTDQQRRDALLHLCGAVPQQVIGAFAAVTGQ